MSLIAGIDIGSTSVKISLFDINKKAIISSHRSKYVFETNERLKQFPEYCQQSVPTIIACLQKALSEFDVELRQQIKLISFCGQMHGCVLWNNNSFYEYNDKSNDFEVKVSVSDLYNWQDNRCDHMFLHSLPEPDSYIDRLSSGFGCSTIFWLRRNSFEFVDLFNSSGTIMDFMVAILCDLKRPVMSTHNANSWGYFDPIAHSWNYTILKSNDFPIDLLPIVQNPGSVAGHTKYNWLGIAANTPVLVALGDLQSYFYVSVRNNPNSAVLNVSTSMQLSVLMDKHFIPHKKSQSTTKSIDYYPYFDGQYLSVSASLNGGNVLQSFIKTIKNFVENITDSKVSEDQIWAKLFKSYKSKRTERRNNELIVKPTLFGERYNTKLKASIENISDSIELNEMIEAFCKGLVRNIFDMMSVQFLKDVGVQRVIGTGTALLSNPILKDALEKKLNLPVVYMEGNDADVGTAWIAFDYYYKSIHNLNHNSTQS